jgi:hypothetical protein
MTTYDSRIVASDRLIFFPFSLLTWQVMYTTCLLCFLLFNLSPHSIIFLVSSLFIYISFYSFQFSPSIAIFHVFGFSFRSSFFLISYFIPCSFVEVFCFNLSFNQIFYCFIFFNLILILLVFFFPFIKAIFQFDPPNWKFVSF